MSEWLDDEDFLLRRLSSGDAQAIDFLFKKYYAEMLRLSYTVLKNREAGKDIIQDIFIAIWEKRASLHFSKPIKAYLFRAVINRSLNYLRDQGKTKMLPLEKMEAGRHASSAGLSSEKLEEKELEQFILRLIHRLPPQCRVAFELSRHQQMSNKEIAAYMDISVKAVEKHMARALKQLRKGLEAYLKRLFLFCW
ncbi:RNA polymerase sigma-70 factor [Nafulsella turpanensis]|uniref:RNA polymerase sigma-70 factor n=1 Tax=Nafulsella turpanensis TaxID=1265690 RepID=UPI000344C6E8|nr:RNA polymerase sigma-70 factor [Nafulsella turpanensis]